MQTGYKKQHRRQYDPEGILPQFGGHQSGFNPLGAGSNRLQEGGLTRNASSGTSLPSAAPSGNLNHSRTASSEKATGVIPPAGGQDVSYSTGYPVQAGQQNQAPGVVVRQIGEDVV